MWKFIYPRTKDYTNPWAAENGLTISEKAGRKTRVPEMDLRREHKVEGFASHTDTHQKAPTMEEALNNQGDTMTPSAFVTSHPSTSMRDNEWSSHGSYVWA